MVFKTFFNGFQWRHNEKRPPQAKNLGTPFLRQEDFLFSFEDSSKKLLTTYELNIVRPIFPKKGRRRRKNFEAPFFKKKFLGKFNGF